MIENLISRKYLKGWGTIFLLLICGILLLVKVDSAYAVDCSVPGRCPEIVSGLTAAIGVAIDEPKNQLYFVEFNPAGNGTLKRINLPPQCGTPATPACNTTIIPITSGFSHPEDMQLDLAHGFAYVTTRDDPGSTGALWKVNISDISACSPTCPKNKVTFNLGAPQQLVLDVANNQAYTVGYDDGRLRRIDLTTGAKTPLTTGLGHPVGLAITKDRKYAYVSEQDAPARISKIALTTGIKDPNPVVTGLTAPFSLTWTDSSQNSLYVVERDPANRVLMVDLITKAKNDAITGLPWRPSGIVVSGNGTPVFVTTDSKIVKVDMVELDFTQPVFMGVGHVPATSIVNGYATTDPWYFFQVKHSPFGGTLNIFGNLNNFKALGATHYEILVSKDGGAFLPLNLSWNMYKWNPATLTYELVPVAPVAGTTRYLIPAEYPLNAAWWYPPFLFMQWPSGENGLYTFMVKIYPGTIGPELPGLPAGLNSVTVRIDNTPQDVKILSIWQKGSPDKEINPCDIISTGNNQYYFKITAYDPNHHLLSYGLRALWGDNKSASIASDSYTAHVDVEGPYLWSGVMNENVPAACKCSNAICAADPSPKWCAQCNCAHTFYLDAWKRTIDGYNYILYRDYHKSITINNTGTTCP